jgi:hypothetical protein
MADTVESLRAELNALRKDFEDFKTYTKPVIDDHQPSKMPLQPVRSIIPPPRPQPPE